MRVFLVLVWIASAHAAVAQDVRYRFEWHGGGDYVMRGAMSFDARLLGKRYVLETDLSCFEISGSKNGAPVGRFALQMLLPDTTWRMTFDPISQAFVVYGDEAGMPQAWNMDGFGTDCGDPGFGFNIGNAAQDLCLNGALLVESQVDPERPFPAFRDDGVRFSPDACTPDLLLGALE